MIEFSNDIYSEEKFKIFHLDIDKSKIKSKKKNMF